MGEVCLLNPVSSFQQDHQDKSFLDISNSYNRSPGFVDSQHMFAQSPFGFGSQQQEIERTSDSPASVDQSMFDSPSYQNESMDQVQQLIVKEVMKDITVACQYLNIPQDPQYWTHEQVEKWILWTFHHYGMQPANMECFAMTGYQLCMLTDINFRQIDPRCGDILYAHLDIWKTAAKMYPVPQMQQQTPFLQQEVKQEEQYMDHMFPHPSDNTSIGSNSDDEVSLPSPTASGPNTSMTPNHKGGIHLWQFLKELLLQPDSYSYCIRWLNRTEGIFKIEDSVEVARLWGLRKNRPAMNYDKLSRSIRQYYKKSIMKKTEVSQRLVYQFVQPC